MYHLIFIVKIKIIMNVCIIGEGLTALSLAKSLINKKINVHYYYKSRNINFLNVLLVFFVVLHLGSVLFGLFHAIWGQYFYFPFLVEIQDKENPLVH